MFNALKYTEILEKAGFSREQAEQSVKVLIEIMEQNLATKNDLKIEALSIRSEMKQMESRIVIKMGAMTFASFGLFAALIKFF